FCIRKLECPVRYEVMWLERISMSFVRSGEFDWPEHGVGYECGKTTVSFLQSHTKNVIVNRFCSKCRTLSWRGSFDGDGIDARTFDIGKQLGVRSKRTDL